MKEIILSAPGKNAIGIELMRRVQSELDHAAGEPLLVTGAGDAFSAGLNLKEVLALDQARAALFLGALEDLVQTLYEYPGPTVALVNGHAIAGGAVLALACDHRVAAASTKAKIGLNEVALGLRFPPKVMKLAKARLPAQHWGRVLLGAELFDAERALEVGLLDELAEDAAARAGERLAALAAHPPDAYARAKASLRQGVLATSPEEEAAFARDDLPTWTSEALHERIRKLLAR